MPESAAAERAANGGAAGDVSVPESSAAEDSRRRKKQQQELWELRQRLKGCEFPVEEAAGLASFYDVCLCVGPATDMVAAGPSPALPAALVECAGAVPCLKGVTFSAWNPPPAQRRLCGDLFYLEVRTLDDGVLHVTATPAGFYINAINNGNFDPAPAPVPCFSHELVTCLLTAAPSFRKAWVTALAAAAAAAQQADSADEVIAAMVAEGRLDSSTVTLQWNIPAALGTTLPAAARVSPGAASWSVEGHMADPNRAEEDLSNGFGMDERGALRDWNDEHQGVRDLPRGCLEEGEAGAGGGGEDGSADGSGEGAGKKSPGAEGAADGDGDGALRCRMLYRVLSEFHQAAVQGAVAIVHGFVSPINLMEPARTHVFVYNNIFFSYAVDSRDAFRAVVGDVAAHKAAALDLAGVVALNRLDLPQLNTLATSVVDYRGHRLIAQSVIAGILQGDQASRLIFGAVEHTQELKTDAALLDALRAAGRRLFIAERAVPRVPMPPPSSPPTGEPTCASAGASPQNGLGPVSAAAAKEKAAATGNNTVPICGPMELKGIKGADERRYVLDIVRLTPRDANWVRGPKGTGVWDAWLRARGDRWAGGGRGDLGEAQWERVNAEYNAVLRPELVMAFVRQQLQVWRRDRHLALITRKQEEQRRQQLKEQRQLQQRQKKNSGAAGGDKAAAAAAAAATAAAAAAEAVESGAAAAAAAALGLTDADVVSIQADEAALLADLALNINVFMPYPAAADLAVEAADERRVTAAATMMWEQIIPALTLEAKRGAFMPLDGRQLTSTLHSAGVNCRYMGRLAALALEEEAADMAVAVANRQRRYSMPLYWLELLEVEMVARGAKHRLAALLRATPRAVAVPGPTVTAFLNCLVGTPAVGMPAVGTPAVGTPSAGAGAALGAANTAVTANGSSDDGGAIRNSSGGGSTKKTNGKKVVGKDRGAAVVAVPLQLAPPPPLDHVSLWAAIAEEVQDRFRYKLTIWGPHLADLPAAKRAHRLPLLRRFCEQTGARVLSRRYDFSVPEPFGLTDVIDLAPVAKSCLPTEPSLAATAAADAARAHLSAGSVGPAYHLALQAVNILQGVCGGLHETAASATALAAIAAAAAGDASVAVNHGMRALALNEQAVGFDSVQSTQCHSHLATFYQQAGSMDKAIVHLRALCYLVALMAGPNHPELSAAYYRMGQAYQEIGHMPMAMRCMQHALQLESSDLDENASILRSVAELLGASARFKEALQMEKRAYSMLRALYGDGDPRVQKSALAMERLTERAVEEANKQHRARLTQGASPAPAAAAAAAGASVPVAAGGGGGVPPGGAAHSLQDDAERGAEREGVEKRRGKGRKKNKSKAGVAAAAAAAAAAAK
ncbi:unnamed protein product [Phaeothamnion confervicola]